VVSPSQSVSGVSAINPLVAFYDIHGRKRGVLFFYSVPDTTRGYITYCTLFVTDIKPGEVDRSTKHNVQSGTGRAQLAAKGRVRETASAAVRGRQAGALRHAGLAFMCATLPILRYSAAAMETYKTPSYNYFASKTQNCLEKYSKY
jgi:hypothetical protein